MVKTQITPKATAPVIPEVINKSAQLVKVETLKRYPGNARIGDVDTIVESIRANGFYGSLIVQKTTRFVLVGNHSLDAAIECGMSRVPVTWVDVDVETARRINLVDNRSAERGDTDYDQLRSELQELTDLVGSGFDEDDLEAMLTHTKPRAPAKEKRAGTYPIAAVPNERYEYLIILSTNRADWDYLRDAFHLGKCEDNASGRVGVGHVVKFEDFKRRWTAGDD